jgi:hypothetical protein
MTIQDILIQRLNNQQLAKHTYKTPQEVIYWLGAMQSQDYGGAKWALGQRLENYTDAILDEAYDKGEILRTHALRPTWHFVHPDDILWITRLNATRVKPILRYYYNQLDLTDKVLEKAQNIIQEALQGGKALTRTELGNALLQAKVPGRGQALGHIMSEVELNGVVCSGPRKGKQFTYMLLKDRAPHAKELSLEESVIALTKRYFQSHGPATIKDFAWWSGLTVADCTKGIKSDKDLQTVTVGNLQYYYFENSDQRLMPEVAYLLPNYDEYTIAYKQRDAFYDPTNAKYFDSRENVAFGNMIVVHGEIIAMWKRLVKSNVVEIQVLPFKSFSKTETKLIHKAFERYGTFLDKTIKLL